jgi:RNA polymerase sigma factor (sigma-70 family)
VDGPDVSTAPGRRPRLPLLGGGEARLVAAARAGDEQAFAAIVQRHERALRGYAAKLLRDTGLDPEDVVQDVLIRAHAALTSGDERELALKPWLFRMTRNRVIDVLRRRDRPGESLDAEHAVEPAAAASAGPAQSLGRREALRALLADLAELPEQQRDALLMRELEGLSHESVATQLGVTPEATRMLVVRARENLVKSVAARDAACADIRADLAGAHDARRRPSEHARRHLRGCAPCRSYREDLRGMRRSVALLHPGPAFLALLGAGKLGVLGFSGGGGKTVAAIAAAVAVTAGAAGVVIIEHPTLHAGDPAPRAVPGGRVVLGRTIRPGTPLPPGTAQIERSVRLPPVQRKTRTVLPLTCPAGYVARNVVPDEGGGPAYRGARLADPVRLGHARSVDVEIFWTRTPKPYTAVLRFGLVCSKKRG